jgi:zinc protease
MTMSASVTKDTPLEEVRDILISIVEQVGTTGVTAEEVNRAKQQYLRNRERAAQDTAAFGVAMSTWIAQGDWRLYFLQRDRIEKVTPEMVQAAAAKYLVRNNRTVGLFIPTEKSERIAVPEAPTLASLVADYKGREAVAEGEAFDASPANVESRVKRMDLPEGIKVTLLPKKTRGGEVRATLTLRYGNEQNLKGMEQAASFLPELMMRGTKKLTQQQIHDELDRLNATLGAGGGGGGGRGGRGGGGGAPASAGSVSFSMQAKRDTLPAVLEILKQVLREPTLPADQFEIMKRGRLSGLEASRSDPATLASLTLRRQMNPYSRDDIRYIPTIDESVERLKGATYEQVVQLYKDYLGSQSGELTIVGDFDPDTCLPVLKSALSGWKAGKAYARIANPVTREVPGSLQKINTPDKANATYTAGIIFPMRDDNADYPALLMGDYILGSGTLSSRLGVRIRQKDGLSYGVTSSLSASPQDQRAGLTITAICNPQNMDRVAQDVQEEIVRLLKDGVTKTELEEARKGWLQSRKVSRSTDAALAGALSNLRYLDRTMNYDAEFEKKIESLTPEQVLAALRKYIDPKKLVIVTAGDFGVQSTAAKTDPR